MRPYTSHSYQDKSPYAPTLPTTERACLKCNKLFMSYGASNRICEPCAQKNKKAPKRVDKGGTRSTAGLTITGS